MTDNEGIMKGYLRQQKNKCDNNVRPARGANHAFFCLYSSVSSSPPPPYSILLSWDTDCCSLGCLDRLPHRLTVPSLSGRESHR